MHLLEAYVTKAEQIVAFLQKNKPRVYCDDCIGDELGLRARQSAAGVTHTLGLTSDYLRKDGVCCICKNDRPKLVICAVAKG